MGHTSVLMDHNLIIHGGFYLKMDVDKSDPAVGGDDTGSATMVGDLLQQCYLGDFRILNLERMEWSRLRTHGTAPKNRFGHTMMATGNDLICFGGWHGVDKSTWAVKGKNASQSAENGGETSSSENCMILRTSDMTWSNVSYTGEAPVHRYMHTCTAIGPHLIIFGGFDGGKPLADLVVLREVMEE